MRGGFPGFRKPGSIEANTRLGGLRPPGGSFRASGSLAPLKRQETVHPFPEFLRFRASGSLAPLKPFRITQSFTNHFLVSGLQEAWLH